LAQSGLWSSASDCTAWHRRCFKNARKNCWRTFGCGGDNKGDYKRNNKGINNKGSSTKSGSSNKGHINRYRNTEPKHLQWSQRMQRLQG
jgi:hypothetical protein